MLHDYNKSDVLERIIMTQGGGRYNIVPLRPVPHSEWVVQTWSLMMSTPYKSSAVYARRAQFLFNGIMEYALRDTLQ